MAHIISIYSDMLYIVCRWWGGCHVMWAKASSNRWSSRRSPSNESLSYCWIFLHAFRFIFCFICYILFPVSFLTSHKWCNITYVSSNITFLSQSLKNAKKDKKDAQKRISKDTETSRSISSAHSRSKVTESLIQVNQLRLYAWLLENYRFSWPACLLLTPFNSNWPRTLV